MKISRKYLNWVQNSVLEGEINDANFKKLKLEIKKLINEEEDSCIFYTFRTTRYTARESIGVKKGGEGVII